MRFVYRILHVIDGSIFRLRTGIDLDGHEYETERFEVRGAREYELLRCRCGARTELWRWMP